jgi:hypothetical protein
VLVRLAVFALLLAYSAPFAAADHKIWTAVVVASNAESPKPAAPGLQRLVPGMKRVFKFNQFEMVGSAVQMIDEPKEQWLAPTAKFPVRAVINSIGGGNYKVDFALFQDQRKLVESTAKLTAGSPVFIRGPMHARGQLIIVFEIRH